MSLFSFGKGKIQVRLYTDYFCGPCSNLEPRIEYLITDLVKRNIVTITFIDTPLHKYSTLYAKYFLYILNDNKNLDHALKARAALFEASKVPIDSEAKLEAFLQFNEYEILNDAGRVSHEVAKQLAEEEYERFRVEQDHRFESDFERATKHLKKDTSG